MCIEQGLQTKGSLDPVSTSGLAGSFSASWGVFWFQLSHIWCNFSCPSPSLWSTPCFMDSICSTEKTVGVEGACARHRVPVGDSRYGDALHVHFFPFLASQELTT